MTADAGTPIIVEESRLFWSAIEVVGFYGSRHAANEKVHSTMFRLSKRADYGLIALKHLALHDEHAYSAPEIARTYNIPSELMAKVLQKLVREGLLSSQSGPHGGYALARDPQTISVIDVIEALEGPLLLTPCEAADDCEQLDLCSIRDPLRTIKEKVVNVLVDTTIHELATSRVSTRGKTPLEQLEGQVPTPQEFSRR